MIEIFPAVGGSLGRITNNIFVGQSRSSFASITPAIVQESGLSIGDVLLLTDIDDVTNLYQVATGFVLQAIQGGSGSLTAAQIKQLYESNGDTNEFNDALLAKLNDVRLYPSITELDDIIQFDKTALDSTGAVKNVFSLIQDVAGTTVQANIVSDGSGGYQLSFTEL